MPVRWVPMCPSHCRACSKSATDLDRASSEPRPRGTSKARDRAGEGYRRSCHFRCGIRLEPSTVDPNSMENDRDAAIATVLVSPRLATEPAIVRAHPPGEDALVGSRRSTVSNGYRASCANRTRQMHRATLKHYDKPLQSMKTIPLDTRRSSPRGLPVGLGKERLKACHLDRDAKNLKHRTSPNPLKSSISGSVGRFEYFALGVGRPEKTGHAHRSFFEPRSTLQTRNRWVLSPA